MNPVARVRHVLARRPWLYWLAVLVLAATAGLVVADAAAGVEAARRSWGDTAPSSLPLSTSPLVSSSPTTSRSGRRPEPMVPARAVSALPSRATARQRIAAGEMIMAHDVVATDGPQAMIPDGCAPCPSPSSSRRAPLSVTR